MTSTRKTQFSVVFTYYNKTHTAKILSIHNVIKVATASASSQARNTQPDSKPDRQEGSFCITVVK